MRNQLRLAGFLLAGFISIASVAQPVRILDRADEAYIQRVLQYENQLDSELQADIALCIDESMGNTWFLGTSPSIEVRPALVEKLRRTAETCTVAKSAGTKRLSAQIRKMTEDLLKKARSLERPLANARACVSDTDSQPEFRSCVTKALAKPSSEIDWDHWMVLFARKNPS